jgi:CxxC motif-containing protein (DUF1111 family)
MATAETVQARLRKIHPAFVDASGAVNTTIVLHRHSTERGYSVWRDDLLNMKRPGERELDPLLRLFPMQIASLFVTRERLHSPGSVALTADGLEFEITERNTPALFGAAAINSVNDKLLARVAQRQAREFPGISGRVPRSIDGRVGRFGWRGQVATLQDFVQNACATELGLQLVKRSQAASPLGARAQVFDVADKKKEAQPHTDMDARQVMDLTGFVMRLPRPRQTKPTISGATALSHISGERVFNDVGCAACHMRKVGKIDGLYSDLLLHDMGPDLSDPAAAIPPGGTSFSSGGYYSGGTAPGITVSSAVAELRREWRTPPLWGVNDSAPYLHDGRAATIEEAVRAHGGEAEAAAKRFRELTAIERDSMLTFLATLVAP